MSNNDLKSYDSKYAIIFLDDSGEINIPFSVGAIKQVNINNCRIVKEERSTIFIRYYGFIKPITITKMIELELK